MHQLSNDLKFAMRKKIMDGINNNKAIIIKTDYTTKEAIPKADQFSLEELQESVGGDIEAYPHQVINKAMMFVDEEGILKQRKLNQLVYDLFGISVLGDVIIVPFILLH